MGAEYLLGLDYKQVLAALVVDLTILAFVVWRLG